jgi:hypothetical protein
MVRGVGGNNIEMDGNRRFLGFSAARAVDSVQMRKYEQVKIG